MTVYTVDIDGKIYRPNLMTILFCTLSVVKFTCLSFFTGLFW